MTLTQIVVIVVGLVAGYRLVSYMLSPGTGDKQRRPPRSPDPQGPRRQPYESAWSDAPPPPPRWYTTLGVGESASLEEIDQAYRVQISQYHPDKVARLGEDLRQLAEARSKEINAAYDTAVRLRGGRGHDKPAA